MRDVDTFLTTVYCLVDDLNKTLRDGLRRQGPGRRPEVADSEILTLMLLSQWRSDRSERGFVRYASSQLRGYFPRLLSQSAFNRRSRHLSGVLCQLASQVSRLGPDLAGHSSAYGVLDTIPVPLMRYCRGRRQRLFRDEAALGHGGSDQGWYYGVQLLTEVDANGFISGFLFGPADTSARWLAEALLRWRLYPEAGVPNANELAPILGPTHLKGGKRVGPTGPILPRLGVGEMADHDYLADLAFRGKAWNRHWHDHYRARVRTKADYERLDSSRERQLACRWLASKRQIVEQAYNVLTSVFALAFPRARTLWGLLTRIAAKVAAYDISIYFNYLNHRPTFAIFHPLP